MLFLIAVCSLVASVAAASDTVCHACINNICFTKQRFRPVDSSLIIPLAVDHTDNILYIQYKDRDYNDIVLSIYLNESNRMETILNMTDNFLRGAAIDQSTRDVYFYGHKGVYKYNPILNITTTLNLTDQRIGDARFKDKLYFTVLEETLFGIHVMDVHTKQSELIAPTTNYSISDFVVDRDSDVYFTGHLPCDEHGNCVYGVYRFKNGSDKVEKLFTRNYKLTLDKNDVVHLFDDYNEAIYKLDPADALVLVGTIDSKHKEHIMFDNNYGIFYRFIRDMYYLSPESGASCIVKGKHV